MKPSQGLAALAWILLMIASAYAADRIAMHTWLAPERRFLEDIDHRPAPGAQFNEHGVRDLRRLSTFRPEDLTLVVLGDSFVFGYGLKPSQTIPWQMERMLRTRHRNLPVKVVNFGYISASPYLSLRQLRDFGSAYAPDLVLLCIDMTDFHDDIKYQKYDEKPGLFGMLRVFPSGFFALKEAARRLGVHEALFGYPADRFFVVNRPLEETRPHLASIQRNIDAIADYVREELGARFGLVILPRAFQYSAREAVHSWERDMYTPLGPYVLEPFRYFEQIAPARDYPIHSLLPAFRETDVFPTTFRRDPHWNPAGARVAARALVRFVEESGLLEAGTGATLAESG